MSESTDIWKIDGAEDTRPATRERLISQIPAVELLLSLGYDYLSPARANELRNDRKGQVVLEPILREQLRAMNRIEYRDQEYPFDETAIDGAIAALTNLPYESLPLNSETVFDLISLGKSFLQTVEGDRRSFDIHYIDWERPERNVFHVSEEFAVERAGSRKTYRPDLVLFVNGIPLGVIECKAQGDRALGIDQHLRYQQEDGITRLYQFSQILATIDKDGAEYATTRTRKEFWATWKESLDEEELARLVNRKLPIEKMVDLFWRREEYGSRATSLAEPAARKVTPQDRLIYALFRPERLLEITRKFVVYDAGQKKIARYQQYRAVRNAMERVTTRDEAGLRRGGIVWHTQGSGKSLTMVMLGKSLALEPAIVNPRLILVTDRVELDKQIGDTFRYCGYEPISARDGLHLRSLIESRKGTVVTTVINKFERAVKGREDLDTDDNLFVLVDEGHRTNFGTFHAMMRKALPRACYLGFTGTPIVKREKNNVRTFGEFIDQYTIEEAVVDGAVVRLLYEGRHIEQDVDQETLDRWFERLMRGKSDDEKADFKRKFGNADHVNRADERLRAVAWDLSEHFASRFQGTGAKGQLVAPRKEVALRYKALLDEIGIVSSEVLISSPDSRESDEETPTPDEAMPAVRTFWKEMMDRFRTEDRYNDSLVNRFKGQGDPEIVIVVSKLLTGFDAPQNTVLYIDKSLSGHTLLQAIARVNRRAEGKDFGYIIDYYGILGNLNEALSSYESLAEYEEEDIARALRPISLEIANLPEAHTNLWAIFAAVKNREDDEQFAECLEHVDQRDEFYERLNRFSRLFEVAMASHQFLSQTPEEKVERYRNDLRYFQKLRSRMRLRYSEEIDYREYERRIQKLINQHVGAGEVLQVTELVDIFDKERFDHEVEQLEGAASRADTIAHRTERTIREKWDQDPVFYERFSKILRKVIDDFRTRRITDSEYLHKVKEVMQNVRKRGRSDVPESLKHEAVARAFYGHAIALFGDGEPDTLEPEERERYAGIGLGIDEIVRKNCVIDWTAKRDVKNQMRNEIEDFLLEISEKEGLKMSFEQIDPFLERAIATAQVHYAK